MGRDRFLVGTRFSARPDRPWGPPSLLYNGYPVFPGCRGGPGVGRWALGPSSVEVLERVEPLWPTKRVKPKITPRSQINPFHAPYPTSWRYNLILSSNLRPVLRSGLFLTNFSTKTLCASLHTPIHATFPAYRILPEFNKCSLYRTEFADLMGRLL